MKHPKVRINLADVFKTESHKPLAVGDKVTKVGDEDVYCIYGQVNTRTTYVRNEKSPLLWGNTIEAANRESLTQQEAEGLLWGVNKEWLKSWLRINPDGSKTSLGDIYAERVEVGAGSWISGGDDESLFFIGTHGKQDIMRVFPSTGWIGNCAVQTVVDVNDLTLPEVQSLLTFTTDKYTLLPPADAWKLLAEMEDNHG